MTTLFLIRHAAHDAIGHHLAGQRAGLSLNAAGRAQLPGLVAALHDVPLTAVVSSPLERTRETAAPIARDHGLELTIAPDLIEFDHGDWTGRTFASLQQDDEWQRFNAFRSITPAPGGELMLAIQSRAVAALLASSRAHPSGAIAAVFHGDVIRAALLYFLGAPIDFFHRLEISPARISIVELEPRSIRVLQVNGDSVPRGA
jgi:broad specificity phosphatase PhoE